MRSLQSSGAQITEREVFQGTLAMVTTGEACERKRQLLQDLLSRISRAEGAIASQNGSEHPGLNEMLQRAIKEREQALKAVETHQQEHGC